MFTHDGAPPSSALIVICSAAGEQVGAVAENDKLGQIQPRRWSPSARSCCTCVEMVIGQAFGGSFSSVLIAELAEASIFLKICPRNAGCLAAASSACADRLPPPALEPGRTARRRRRSHAQFSFFSARICLAGRSFVRRCVCRMKVVRRWF